MTFTQHVAGRNENLCDLLKTFQRRGLKQKKFMPIQRLISSADATANAYCPTTRKNPVVFVTGKFVLFWLVVTRLIHEAAGDDEACCTT